VTPERARRDYRVVLGPDLAADAEETARLRATARP
jgi:hypothetical protein